jgi:uncharacterized RDD family membrane protein YckC
MSNPMFSAGAPAGSQSIASAGMRILARFLDAIILAIVGSIIGSVLGAGAIATGRRGSDVGAGKYFVAVLLSVIVSFVYDAVLTSKIGGTPMKKAFGMRVADAATGNSPVSLQQAATRWAIPGILSLIPVLGALASFVIFIVSLIFLFTDKNRQTVSDKIGKTVVLKG